MRRPCPEVAVDREHHGLLVELRQADEARVGERHRLVGVFAQQPADRGALPHEVELYAK